MKRITIKDLETGESIEFPPTQNYALLIDAGESIGSSLDCTVLSMKRFINTLNKSIESARVKEKKEGKIVDMSDYLSNKNNEDEYFVGITLVENKDLKNHDVVFCFLPKKEMIIEGGKTFDLFKKIIEEGMRKGEKFMSVIKDLKSLDKDTVIQLSLDGTAKVAMYSFKKEDLCLLLQLVEHVSRTGYFINSETAEWILIKMREFAKKKNLYKFV